VVSGSAATAQNGREVSFLSEDSVHLKGTYWPPRQSGRCSVALIHDFGGSRNDWLPFIPFFRSRGWAILAFDLRGHGDSLHQDLHPHALTPEQSDLRSPIAYPNDTKAALAFIERQPHTESGTIAAIGVGIGADLAYAAAARGWGTASTVLIGLDDSRARDLAGSGPFAPRNVYLMYASGDPVAVRSAESLLRTAARPSEVFAYPDTASTGMALVREKSPELLARAIAWIERTL
jgi:pimeloyl-ACP methyl ester carboxylesterase